MSSICTRGKNWLEHSQELSLVSIIIVTVGDSSPRQARGHIGDVCVKWKHFLKDVADVADQTGTVRGRIERVEMSLTCGFHMIMTLIVSICRRLIGDTSPKCRRLLRSYGNQALLNNLMIKKKNYCTIHSYCKTRKSSYFGMLWQ